MVIILPKEHNVHYNVVHKKATFKEIWGGGFLSQGIVVYTISVTIDTGFLS